MHAVLHERCTFCAHYLLWYSLSCYRHILRVRSTASTWVAIVTEVPSTQNGRSSVGDEIAEDRVSYMYKIYDSYHYSSIECTRHCMQDAVFPEALFESCNAAI